MKTIAINLLLAFFFLSACSDEQVPEESENPNVPYTPDETENTAEWLIPENEVRDGGPGKDGIPALSDANFINVQEADFLSNDDLVLGFADGNDVRAYPHSILDWHEIINDDTENHSLAIIYCPLTGTGIGWNRIINEKKTSFGVSGLLYNTNIIPYDRQSNSNWSQLLLKSVNGELKGTKAATYNLVETTWKTWKEMYPSTKVVSTNTGYSRNYGRYPYGDYKTSETLIFPVSNKDNRLHEKERVLGVIINGEAAAFTFEKNSSENKVVSRVLGNTKLVVVKNTNANFMLAFDRVLNGVELSFEAIQNELPVVIVDNKGTKWDVFGRATSGPGKGQQLTQVPQMMGYWFSFAAFYPSIKIL